MGMGQMISVYNICHVYKFSLLGHIHRMGKISKTHISFLFSLISLTWGIYIFFIKVFCIFKEYREKKNVCVGAGRHIKPNQISSEVQTNNNLWENFGDLLILKCIARYQRTIPKPNSRVMYEISWRYILSWSYNGKKSTQLRTHSFHPDTRQRNICVFWDRTSVSPCGLERKSVTT